MLVAIAVAAVVMVVLIAMTDLVTAGIACACISALTLPWNGFMLGGQRPGDEFIGIALLLFVAGGLRQRIPNLPLWTTQLGVVIFLVGVLHQIIPTDAKYLAERVVVAANGAPIPEFETNLFVTVKFIIAIIALPLMIAYAIRQRPASLRWLVISNVVGAATSGFIAFTDGQGLSTIGTKLTHKKWLLAREGGLSNHPNFLAAGCVVAMPLAVWLIANGRRRDRIIGSICAIGLLLGVYASGSRGGSVCIVFAGLTTLFIDPRFRRHLGTVVFGVVLLGALTFVAAPRVGDSILNAVRLTGNNHTADSNSVRKIVAKQGINDVKKSPIDGVGLQVAADATNVYIQELASGGLLLFLSMQVFTLGGLWAAFRLRSRYDIAEALLAALLAAAILNYFEADLTDRFFYVPAAITAALVAVEAERERNKPGIILPRNPLDNERVPVLLPR